MVEKRWYEVMLRIIKTILYAFLFVAILSGTVIAKGTILFAVSQINANPVPYCDYYPGKICLTIIVLIVRQLLVNLHDGI